MPSDLESKVLSAAWDEDDGATADLLAECLVLVPIARGEDCARLAKLATEACARGDA